MEYETTKTLFLEFTVNNYCKTKRRFCVEVIHETNVVGTISPIVTKFLLNLNNLDAPIW